VTSEAPNPLVKFLADLRDASWFQNFIIAIILSAGVVVGIQTYPSMVAKYGVTMDILDSIILWIFVAEILIKMGAEGRRPWRFFYDGWNVFDFLIVAVCFLPIGAEYVAVLRLARLLRVLKLVKALPRLQVLVGALLKSIPSMFYIGLLLFGLFYLYSVLATFLFQANDPVHFENLQTAHLTMFRVSTLEDWTDVMYINMFGCDMYGYDENSNPPCTAPHAYGWFAAIFFSSFVLLATMIILNLFIGVIMTGMDEAAAELNVAPEGTFDDRMNQLVKQLQKMQDELADLAKQKRAKP
jgi:voltage-gated sodium channel